MKEVVDTNSGAILFKNDEGNPTDKKIQILEREVDNLNRKVSDLYEEISRLKHLIDIIVNK